MNTISAINSTLTSLTGNTKVNNVDKTASDGESFDQLLKNSIKEVNNSQVEGYNAMRGIATGEVKNLQEAVQKIEEAELSLKLALEVKNKAINAFKEVSKMSV